MLKVKVKTAQGHKIELEGDVADVQQVVQGILNPPLLWYPYQPQPEVVPLTYPDVFIHTDTK